jgi:hypothetical protein
MLDGRRVPMDVKKLSVTFLELLVAGIDHEAVGCPGWYEAILRYAPRAPHTC